MLSCCLLETSLITAGAQAKVYFRTPSNPSELSQLQKWVFFFLCPTWAGDRLQVLVMTGAGKKSFDLQYRLHQPAWTAAVRARDWLSDNRVWLTVTSASLQRSCLAWVSPECPFGVHTPGQGDPACNLTWSLRRHWDAVAVRAEKAVRGWKCLLIFLLMWIVRGLLLWWNLTTFSLLSQNLLDRFDQSPIQPDLKCS